MTLTPDETNRLMLIEQRVANEGPNLLAAYLLLLLLGLVSAHRFYLGRWQSALLQIASYFFLVGFVWLVLDLFLLPGLVAQARQRIRARLKAQIPYVESEPPPAPAPLSSPGEEIQRLWALKQDGALTQAEFDAQKAILLNGAG